MEETKENVYRALQESLDALPISYPATESGVEIKILKHMFTPKQALIASRLGVRPILVEEIYEKLKDEGLTKEELEEQLEVMDTEGLIYQSVKTEGDIEIKFYSLTMFMLGSFEFQINKMDEEFIHNIDQYFEEAYFEEMNKTKIPQLRTIPIEKDIGDDRDIASYDDFRHYLDNCGEPIVVNECICRKKSDIIGKSCTKTDLRESCFSFRTFGKAFLERGIGREITKEEALEILEQAEREGLVLQVGNSQRPTSLCTCCGDCCNLLVNEKRFDAPAQYFGSNYYAQVDEDLCTGCGVCETRCQMDAVEIIDGISNINLGFCIGCGVCVPTCPEEAIELIEKEEKTIPANSTTETYMKIMKVRAELEKK